MEIKIACLGNYKKNYGGGGRIRTYVALWAADLQSAPINHSGTPP